MNKMKKLANIICSYSCDLKTNDKVWVEYKGANTKPFIKELVKEIAKHKATAYINNIDEEILASFISTSEDDQIKAYCKTDFEIMKKMDAYISIRGSDNIYELSKIPSEKKQVFNKLYSEVTEYRVNNTKWVALRYPSYSMAQLASMPLDDFDDFYFNVCTLDYLKLSSAMDALQKIMQKTDKVKILAKNTNIEFSIKNIASIKCDGKMNLPDGEVYTAPVKNSVNGMISYNTPSNINGITHENIVFEVSNGKIIKASSSQQKALDDILNTDSGARYFGEFAIGVNPLINKPMLDTLFDEKIYGSLHLTPGRAYQEADNGNNSAIHWDLVLIQTPDYGGGEIYFDDILIRKDGEFVHKDLLCLNKNMLI